MLLKSTKLKHTINMLNLCRFCNTPWGTLSSALHFSHVMNRESHGTDCTQTALPHYTHSQLNIESWNGGVEEHLENFLQPNSCTRKHFRHFLFFLQQDHEGNVTPEGLRYDATSSWHNFNATLIFGLNEKRSTSEKKKRFLFLPCLCSVNVYGRHRPSFPRKRFLSRIFASHLSHEQREPLWDFSWMFDICGKIMLRDSRGWKNETERALLLSCHEDKFKCCASALAHDSR